jgi:hypothetical protein
MIALEGGGRWPGLDTAFHLRADRILRTARVAQSTALPDVALEAATCIAVGADPTRLTEWIEEGRQRAERIR